MAILSCYPESCTETAFLCSQWLTAVTTDLKEMVERKRPGSTDHHLLLLSSPGNTSFHKYMQDLIQGLDIYKADVVTEADFLLHLFDQLSLMPYVTE